MSRVIREKINGLESNGIFSAKRDLFSRHQRTNSQSNGSRDVLGSIQEDEGVAYVVADRPENATVIMTPNKLCPPVCFFPNRHKELMKYYNYISAAVSKEERTKYLDSIPEENSPVIGIGRR